MLGNVEEDGFYGVLRVFAFILSGSFVRLLGGVDTQFGAQNRGKATCGHHSRPGPFELHLAAKQTVTHRTVAALVGKLKEPVS